MSIEAMEMALEALEISASCVDPYYVPVGKSMIPEAEKAVSTLRQAICQAEKEQAEFQDFVEKVKDVEKKACEIINREWVGLTDDEICEAAEIDGADAWLFEIARNIEAKLKEKNT